MLGAPAAATPLSTRLSVAGDRLFIAATINDIAALALIDSAAATSIIDARFAARLRLGGGEVITARGTGIATTSATLIPGARIGVAGLTLHPKEVAVIDLSDVAARLGQAIPLVLGRDLFDAARLGIDIDGAALTIVDRTMRPPGVRLSLASRRGIETVPVTIEGHPGRADFDLGNGGTVLVGAAFAARHGLPGDRPTRVIAGGGIGGAAPQTSFNLHRFTIGGVDFADLDVAIDTSPTASDANVGVRLLRRFGIVTDFAARGVWLDFRG